MRALRTWDRHERDDFLDQVEEAELVFAGFPKDWGNAWGDVNDDDLPPYVDDVKM